MLAPNLISVVWLMVILAFPHKSNLAIDVTLYCGYALLGIRSL